MMAMAGLVDKYRIHLLITLVLFSYIILFKATPNIINGLYVFVGVIMGMFILDLDFVFYAFYLKPESDISVQVRNLIKGGSLISYLNLISRQGFEIKDLIFHSALMQIIVVAMAYYIILIKGNLFARSFILSLYMNILYVQLNEYNTVGNLERWFAFYKGRTNRYFNFFYFSVIILLFILVLMI